MAQLSSRTANEIISAALRRIGNTTIASDAQVELNNLLDRLYVDLRWPFLKTTVTGTVAALNTSTNLPSDFVDIWDRQSFHIIDPTSLAHLPVTTMSQQQFDTYIYPQNPGVPSKIIVDYNTLTWRLYPVPNKEYNYELVYRTRPARITNFDAVVNFPNDALLEQMIFAWACQFEDDDRADKEFEKAHIMMRQFLKGFNIGTGKNRLMALNQSTFFPPNTMR